MRTALHLAPHPDDEVLGCGAALVGLRVAGWRVVNVACSLGRPPDHARRRRELDRALEILGIEGLVPEPPVGLGRHDDLAGAEARIADLLVELASSRGAALVVGPSPEDAHHGHATVGRAIAAAAAAGRLPPTVTAWWAWGLWRDLAEPNLFVPYGEERLQTLDRALAEHAGEVDRTPYRDALAARARLQAVLGSERVFGFGSGAASSQPFADLLEERTRAAAAPGWRLSAPRVLQL